MALPNNRVRATSPALWVTGEGVPDLNRLSGNILLKAMKVT